MNIDFIFWLLVLTSVSGALWLSDKILFAPRRLAQQLAMPRVIQWSQEFFPIFLLVLIIRAFIAQPFQVPTGSLEPTVLPGDIVLVNQFAYGLRMPVWHGVIWRGNPPRLGDIVVFRYPVNPKLNFVKRVVGRPGDSVSYLDKTLYLNGQRMSQTTLQTTKDYEGHVQIEKREQLGGISHTIYINPAKPARDFKELVVPAGQYLMMGDHRDESDDSRYWGFVSESLLEGKATRVLLSWDRLANWIHKIRWDRTGKKLS